MSIGGAGESGAEAEEAAAAAATGEHAEGRWAFCGEVGGGDEGCSGGEVGGGDEGCSGGEVGGGGANISMVGENRCPDSRFRAATDQRTLSVSGVVVCGFQLGRPALALPLSLLGSPDALASAAALCGGVSSVVGAGSPGCDVEPSGEGDEHAAKAEADAAAAAAAAAAATSNSPTWRNVASAVAASILSQSCRRYYFSGASARTPSDHRRPCPLTHSGNGTGMRTGRAAPGRISPPRGSARHPSPHIATPRLLDPFALVPQPHPRRLRTTAVDRAPARPRRRRRCCTHHPRRKPGGVRVSSPSREPSVECSPLASSTPTRRSATKTRGRHGR